MENVKTVTTNFNRYIYVLDLVRHDSVPWLVTFLSILVKLRLLLEKRRKSIYFVIYFVNDMKASHLASHHYLKHLENKNTAWSEGLLYSGSLAVYAIFECRVAGTFVFTWWFTFRELSLFRSWGKSESGLWSRKNKLWRLAECATPY